MNCSFCKSENPLWIEKTNEGNLFCNSSCQNQYYKIGINTTKLPKDIVILQLSYLKFIDLLKAYNTGNNQLRDIINNDLNFRYRWIQKFSGPLNDQDIQDARKVINIIWKDINVKQKLFFIFNIDINIDYLKFMDLNFVKYAFTLPVFRFNLKWLFQFFVGMASTDVLNFLFDQYSDFVEEKKNYLLQETIQYANLNNFNLVVNRLFPNEEERVKKIVIDYFSALCNGNRIEAVKFVLNIRDIITEKNVVRGLDWAINAQYIQIVDLILSRFESLIFFVFNESIKSERLELIKHLVENNRLDLLEWHLNFSIIHRNLGSFKFLLNYFELDRDFVRRLINKADEEGAEEITEYLVNKINL